MQSAFARKANVTKKTFNFLCWAISTLSLVLYPFQFSFAHIKPHRQLTYLSLKVKNKDAKRYAYDLALMAIAFTHAGDQKKARSILTDLKQSQLSDGSWRFFESEFTDEADTISGSIAWVALAMNTYQKRFRDSEFESSAVRGIRYLAGAFRNLGRSPAGESIGGIAFSPRKEILSVEHQLDWIAAIDSAPIAIQKEFAALRKKILTTLSHLWVGHRFLPGGSITQNKPNTREVYLDTQSWGYLALSGIDGPWKDLQSGIRFNCNHFSRSTTVDDKKAIGFYESNHPDQVRRKNFVWLEGTLGMIVAMKQIESKNKEAYFCGDHTAQDYLTSLKVFETQEGGVKDASEAIEGWFRENESIAATAWHYFAEQGYNPFKP